MQRFLYCTLYEVSCLLGLVLPTASRVVKTGIEKCLCISTASKVPFGWMRYASGTTLSKKPLAFWVQWSLTAYAAGTVLLGRVGGAIVYHPVREIRYWLCPRQ